MEKSRLYEGMFLVDSALGGAEFPGIVKEISGILKRHGATIRQMQRWTERKLCFEIKGIKRGLYILVHFEAPPSSIADMRRDTYLTERLVRTLILCMPELPAPTGDLLSEEGEIIPRPVEEPAPATEPVAVPVTEPAAVSAEVPETSPEASKEEKREE